MKKISRILSLVLALAMVFGLATTAFAADGYTITIENEESGYTYVAYQIFAGTLSADETTLSDVSWGANVDTDKLAEAFAGTSFAGITKVNEVLAKLDGLEKDAALAQEFAEAIAKALTGTGTESAYVEANEAEGTAAYYTISGLKAGYYLVENTLIPKEDAAYTRYILEVVHDVTVSHKGNVPSVDKVILEEDGDDEGEEPDEVKENEVSIGDTVTYQFTGTMPSNIADYDTYYYVFTDTLSKGLTYNNNLKVTVNGVDVTEYFYVNATEYSKTDGTTITVGMQNILALEKLDGVGEITAETEVVVTYTAVLNADAIVGTIGNKNDVYLEYSNDPNNDGDGETTPPPTSPEKPEPKYPIGETPKDEVFTYTTDILIKKVDQDGNALTGAEFTLTGTSVNIVVVYTDEFEVGSDGDYWKLADGTYTTTAPDEDTAEYYDSLDTKYTVTTNREVIEETEAVEVKAYVGEDGKLIFSGLGAGEYTITETDTPDGYNTVAPVKVVITWSEDGTDCTWYYRWDDGDTGNSNEVTIVNQAGSTLPSTGGMGTTIFYVIGGILVLGAAVLLVTRKRMNAEA